MKKKSKFDVVYEDIKRSLKDKLALECGGTVEEDEVNVEDEINEDEDTEDEDTEDDSKDPELVKEFLDNMQINAQGAASGNNLDARGAASGNDVKISSL